MIDLHAHTTASDGSFSPTQLVQHAHEIGLSAIAVTDHDTFGGWDEARAAGEKLGVEVVPGIELSVSDGENKSHLLGYYFERDSELGASLAQLQAERARRNDVIIENLNAMEIPVTMERVRQIAGPDAQIGRPHIATALMELGEVTSVQDAFDTLLKEGGPAYASKQTLHPADAVRLIHAAGGVAVWAHPTRAPSERAALLDFVRGEALLAQWVEWELDGLETYYGAYTPAERVWTRRMTEKHGLLGTGGSDFHGTTKPNVNLGAVNGGRGVPDAVLEGLKTRARHWRNSQNSTFGV